MSPDGDGGFEVNLTAVQTASLSVGVLDFAVIAETEEEKHVLQSGRLEIKEDPTLPGDKRSAAEKDLEAVEKAIRAIIEGGAVQSYQIQTTVGSRQLTRMTLEELEKLRTRLRRSAGILSNNRWRPIRTCLGGHQPRRKGTKGNRRTG